MSAPELATTDSQEYKDLGFGSVVGGANEKRLLNRDGTFNPRREGRSFLESLSAYHFLLSITWKQFMMVVTVGYLTANLIFATAYLACGPNAIIGQEAAKFGGEFGRAFFFSVETLGTIGYGNIQPNGVLPNLIVTIESLTGLSVLALGTGILFARFSRPTAQIVFSDRAVIAPYRNITGLMFRLTNGRGNQLIELEAKVLFTRMEGDSRQYDQLDLERKRLVFFPLSWTIVHPIDEKSPLYGMTSQDLADKDAEILVLLSGIDETFSMTVHARTSYKPPEIVVGQRFVNIYNPVRSDGTVSIDVRKLGETETATAIDEEWDGTETFHHTMHFSAFSPSRMKERRKD
ncbi:MAG TPA: ion channel [Gemmatimonadaceae bacterium]|nr:ion channel [Gemmatimonadaceae bacterium]